MYDGILGIGNQDGLSIVGYADDIALVAEHKNWESTVQKMEAALEHISQWLQDNQLEMAPEKTDIVALKFGRMKREGTVQCENHQVIISQCVKYLGVKLDSAMSFGEHIRAAAARASKTMANMGKLMPNIGGPSEAKRRTLGAVAMSIMLYGAPIWAGAMNVGTYRGAMQSVQRVAALRVCRGYRTVSYDAAVVVASMVPVHLLAMERRRIWEEEMYLPEQKAAERAKTLDLWQREWSESVKGRWTNTLIMDLRPWVTRRHGEVDYFMTQILTGHGSFKEYTCRIGKTENDRCIHCDECDTAEHALFHCPRWERERMRLSTALGRDIHPQNIINIMLRSKADWDEVKATITKIMQAKEREDRAR